MYYYQAEDPEISELYRKFIYESIRTNDFTRLKENELNEDIKKIWTFVKEIAMTASLKIADIIKALKNKAIFTFFAAFNFSPSRITEAFKGVLQLVKKITHLIPGSVSKFIQNGFDKVPEKQREQIILGVNKIDKWVRGMGTPGRCIFAAFLVWLWLQAGLTGDIAYDFDIGEPLDALRGRLSVSEFFLGDSGTGSNRDGSPVLAIEYLGLIATGKLGFGGILPYAQFTNTVFIVASLVKYLSKEVGIRISAGRNKETDIQQAQSAFA